MDLLNLGSSILEAASDGAVLTLRNPSTRELMADAWIRTRSSASPECQRVIKQSQRQSARLYAKGNTEEAFDPDRSAKNGDNVLIAAFIEASALITVGGEPLTIDNLKTALANPSLKFLRDQWTEFADDQSNFPSATVVASPALTKTVSPAIRSTDSGNSPENNLS